MNLATQSIGVCFTFYKAKGEDKGATIVATENRTGRYAQVMDVETGERKNKSVYVYECASLSNGGPEPRVTYTTRSNLKQHWIEIPFTEALKTQPRLVEWLAEKRTLIAD